MTKMNKKNLMVFFLTLASILLVVSNVAATQEIVIIDSVKIADIYTNGNDVSVIAGETINVKVFFTALVTTADVKVKLDLEGEKIEAEATSVPFNIEEGKKYAKTLTLKIPYELQDEVSEDAVLDIKIWNKDFRTENSDINVRVQRPSYNAEIMSISSTQTVEAGELYQIDIVLKNNGYNDLDNLYVTAKISSLGVERTVYFGDLVSIKDKHDDDTEARRFYLQIPFEAKAGMYTLEVEASNNDMIASESKQIIIKNEFSSNILVDKTRKAVAVGEDAEFELVVANPSNKLRVFRIVTESDSDLTTSSNMQLVTVPAGSTKTITITAHPNSEGEFSFDVSVFAGENIVEVTTLSVYASGKASSNDSNSVVALTIILGIIFLVLLGILFVLLRKKPVKTEEFGESYY
jgi:hypothetical protein